MEITLGALKDFCLGTTTPDKWRSIVNQWTGAAFTVVAGVSMLNDATQSAWTPTLISTIAGSTVLAIAPDLARTAMGGRLSYQMTKNFGIGWGLLAASVGGSLGFLAPELSYKVYETAGKTVGCCKAFVQSAQAVMSAGKAAASLGDKVHNWASPRFQNIGQKGACAIATVTSTVVGFVPGAWKFPAAFLAATLGLALIRPAAQTLLEQKRNYSSTHSCSAIELSPRKRTAYPRDVDRQYSERLYQVIERGDLGAARTLLASKANPNVVRQDRETPLCLTVLKNDVSMAQLLLEHKAQPDTAGNEGETPLCLAIFEDYAPMVQLLLKHKAQPEIVGDQGHTAASFAASLRKKSWDYIKQSLSGPVIRRADASAFTTNLSAIFGYNICPPGRKLLEGQCPHYSRFFEKEVNYQGLPNPLCLWVQRALYESIDCVSSITVSELQRARENACQNNLPLIFNGGYSGHSVRYLFLKTYFCVCDTGGMQKKPIAIYQTTSSLDLKNLLGTLVSCFFGFESDYRKKIYLGLKNIPGIQRTQETMLYEGACHLPLQSTGNCLWTSLEAAVWSLIFFSQKEGTFPKNAQRANQLFRQWQATAKVHFLVQFKDKTEGVPFFLPPLMRQEIIESAIFDLQDPRVLTKQARALLRSLQEEFPNWTERRKHFPRVGQTVREFGDQKTDS